MKFAIKVLKNKIELTEWDITSSEEIIIEDNIPGYEKEELIGQVISLKEKLKDYKKALELLEKHNWKTVYKLQYLWYNYSIR